MDQFNQILTAISVWILPLLFAVTLHEAGHAYAARFFGDRTAEQQGRTSLNPLVHVDPFGTVVLPLLLFFLHAGFLFGYARPVPINGRHMRNPRRSMILVSLAGPGMNVAQALVGALLLPLALLLPDMVAPWLAKNLSNLIYINLIFALFNLMPVPPLDGGHVLMGLLPYPQARKLAPLERYGIFVVLALFILVPLLTHGMLDPFTVLIAEPAGFFHDMLLGLTVG